MYENYSVLFVDDEVNILKSLKRGLMDEEYTCFFASSGKEALEIMEKENIAVIVTDMRMPEMNGLVLLQEIKEKWPKTVKIVLSGYTQLQQILATINQVDIFKFITKPWDLENEFKHVIIKALDYYRIIEENETYKIALEKKNQAYCNILKNIDEVIASAKKGTELLGMIGKTILSFNSRYNIQLLGEEAGLILSYQEKIYDLFIKAVQIEEKEMKTDQLFTEIFQIVGREVKFIKCENKYNQSKPIKISLKFIEAILLSILLVFKDEFSLSGLYIQINEGQQHLLSYSLVSPNVCKVQTALMKYKINLINEVVGGIADRCKVSVNAQKANEHIIITLSI